MNKTTIKDELISTLKTWGTKYKWQETAHHVTNFSYHYPLGDLNEFLRTFMREAIVIDSRNWYRWHLYQAKKDAGMGSGKPHTEIHYDVVAAAVGVPVKLEVFPGNRTLLSCEFYDWGLQKFNDLYMARFCQHKYVDNGSSMCYHKSKCIICGHEIVIDSSG